MDKGLLFQFMRVKFREAGFPQAEVDLHMQSFTERYQNQTDEEIEADIRRRGGPTRIAAAMVERRNTVLMADDDYRAFVMSAKAADETSANEAPTDVTSSDEVPANEAPATETPAADVPLTDAADAPAAEQTAAPTVREDSAENAAKQPSANQEEDPLAAWLTISNDKPSEKEDANADITQLFSEPTQNAASDDVLAVTAEIPQATSAPKQPQTQNSTVTAEAQGQMPRPTPQRVPFKPGPAGNADMGSTKILQVPNVASAGTPQNTDARNSASQKKPPQSKEAYQREQAAIWGAYDLATTL